MNNSNSYNLEIDDDITTHCSIDRTIHISRPTKNENNDVEMVDNSSLINNENAVTEEQTIHREIFNNLDTANNFLYRDVFNHLVGSNQMLLRMNQIVKNNGNRLLEEAFKLTKENISRNVFIRKFTKKHEKLVYSFISECYMFLIPESLKKSKGCLESVINCIVQFYNIKNIKIDKGRIGNIVRCRNNKMKEKNKNVNPQNKEIDETITFLKKQTNTVFFNFYILTDVRKLLFIREKLDEIYFIYQKNLILKNCDKLPDLENISMIFKKLFFYNIKVKKIEDKYDESKLDGTISEIFTRATMNNPIDLLSKVNDRSNGIFTDILDEKKFFSFSIGTTPIYVSEVLQDVILKWIMFNLICTQFKMNEPHNRLYELIVTMAGAKGQFTTKGRAAKCGKVKILMEHIEETCTNQIIWERGFS